MLYLDVTSSCKSPMNTGVQRVVRALHRALQTLVPVTPLVWDPGLASYCTLSASERDFLENPFGKGGNARGGDAEPGRRANPIPLWSKLARRFVHRRNRLDLRARLAPGDVLFVPEIFQDNRLAFLADLADALSRHPHRADFTLAAVCHDALAWSRPGVIPPARQAGFAEYLAALGGCDHVLACSRETADDLASFWRATPPPSGKLPAIDVQPWPVRHAGQSRPPLDASTRHPPLLLCVGTFEPRKNHLLLLDAAERAWRQGANFTLVLIGRTTAHHGEQVEEAIDALTKAGRPVRWLKHADDETLRRAYADCAFTVFPSLYEGYGLPILESLWHGRPCVCGGNGAIGEVAAGGGCLTLDQGNPDVLAAGILSLLEERDLYGKLCAEAAGREFGTWEDLARQFLAGL